MLLVVACQHCRAPRRKKVKHNFYKLLKKTSRRAGQHY